MGKNKLIELAEQKKKRRIISGYASTFDIDSGDMQITKTALENAKDDLLKYSTVLFNHDMDRPIGKTIETRVDDRGLFVKIVISNQEDDIWEKCKEGIINKFSIKGRSRDTSITENGRVIQINEIELFEVSLVTIPMNNHAKATKVEEKSLNIEKDNIDIEKMKEEEIEVEKIFDEEEKEIEKDCHCDGEGCDEEDCEYTNKTLSKLIEELQILSGRFSDEDKTIIDEVIAFLKKNLNVEKPENEEDFDFDDTSDDRPIFQLNDSSEMVHESGNKFRKQILKIGKWYHWDAEGGILEITKEMIAKIVKNFRSKIIENVSVPLTHTNDPAKNTGEVIKVIRTKEGLDAIIEIKDDTIAEKIKKGLIKCISASLDPNYRVKTTNKFVGPALLHAALVQEPYIKGMAGFIPLADMFDGRPILQLEDTQRSNEEILKNVNEVLNKLTMKKVINNEEIEKEGNIEEVIEEEEVEELPEEVAEEKIEEKVEEVKEEEKEEEVKEEEVALEDEVKEEEVASEDEVKEEENTASAESSEDIKPEEKAEDGNGKVDFADAEKHYDEYLKAGKIVPAQKDSFVRLFATKKTVNLGDESVELQDLLKAFFDKQPKIVDFEEDGKTDVTPPTAPAEPKIPEAAASFFKEKLGLSDEEAIKSWEYAKEQSKNESKESTIF